MQRPAGLRDRYIQTYCGQRILEHPPLAHVHMHVAGGDERQSQPLRGPREGGEARAIRSIARELDGHPEVSAEMLPEPGAGLLIRPRTRPGIRQPEYAAL